MTSIVDWVTVAVVVEEGGGGVFWYIYNLVLWLLLCCVWGSRRFLGLGFFSLSFEWRSPSIKKLFN